MRCRLVDSLLLHTHNNNIKSQKENSRLRFFSFFFFFLDFFVPLKRIEQVYKEGWLLFLHHTLKDIHTIVYSRKDIMDEISPPPFYIILSLKKRKKNPFARAPYCPRDNTFLRYPNKSKTTTTTKKEPKTRDRDIHIII